MLEVGIACNRAGQHVAGAVRPGFRPADSASNLPSSRERFHRRTNRGKEPIRESVMTGSIRIRVCLALVESGKILLVPHYETDAGEIQWTVPGGTVEYGEALETAVTREFFEETGLKTEVTGVLCVSEVILPERPYHSITISFSGNVIGGNLRAEENHPFGTKTPRANGGKRKATRTARQPTRCDYDLNSRRPMNVKR